MLASAQTRITSLFLAGVVFLNLTLAQDPKLTGLLQRSPSAANAIAYLHVPSLQKLMTDAQLPASLSEATEEVWLVSELDTITLAPAWEAGYAVMKKEVDAKSLVKATGGYVDTVAGQDAVWTPNQSYLVPVSGNRLGFLRPAKRKMLADWFDSTSTTPVPEYLAKQALQPEQYLSLMVAINLEDSFSPITLASRLGAFESLKSEDPAAIASVLASVKGMSIIVGRRSLSECILSLEFGQSPEALAPIASSLLNEILNRNGTSAPEVTSWQPTVEGNKLSFKGAISADSLDGVLGIFTVRSQAENVAQAVASNGAAASLGTGPSAQTSKDYFDKVNAFIERVRKYEAQTTGYRAKWNDQQARRIDELGTLNVDPQLVDYGANVSGMLRNNAVAIQTGNVAAGQVEAAQGLSSGYSYNYNYGYGYGSGSGYYDPNSSTDYQRVTSAQQRGAAFGSYKETISAIDKLTGDVRRAMTEKFGIQF